MHASPWSVDAYRERVLGLVRALPADEVPLLAALGRVVADDICAAWAVPRFDNAAMDGYAVRAADVAGSSSLDPRRLSIVDGAPAGHGRPRSPRAGEAVRIMTGAPIPSGAEIVIPVEQTRPGRFTDEPAVELWESGRHHVRRAGEDIASGERVVERGATLGARTLALLAATGHSRVRVHRRPRVAVITTGDELRGGADAASLAPDDDSGVADSNAVYLFAAVCSLGGEPAEPIRAADRYDSLHDALDRASRDADLIVSTGGLGAGSHDLVGRTAACTEHGVLARVAMRPGRPQAHGTWLGVPWIALPGTPTAAFVSFEAFVRPAFDRLAGRTTTPLTTAQTVSTGWEGRAGAVRYVPLDLSVGDGSGSVSPAGRPDRAAHALSAMFRAPLIGVIGMETSDVVAGQSLSVFEPA